MALKPLQAQYPLGQYDGLDAEATALLGGEVVALTGLLLTSSDKKASDVSDGYAGSTTKRRPVVTNTLVSGMRPLFLADEGLKGYGTLFGEVVGGSVGQVSSGGAQLGPHTATGSGKVTLWDKPGLYAVTLDAVDDTEGTGLEPDNASLNVGAALYATSAGLLTPAVGSAFESVIVARFIEFETNGSLVTTREDMISALNSPTGGVAAKVPFVHAVIHFHGVDG
ncbi:MAG TPA: hypothetical protein VI423_07545 [Paenisporosarcina sp.]|nr:hypothetical protein [Paenisporosarcina sp.]